MRDLQHPDSVFQQPLVLLIRLSPCGKTNRSNTKVTKHRETYHRKEDLDHEIKELEANFELFPPKFD